MEDMALLKKLSFFTDLTSPELKRVNMIIERATFRAGEDIVREGEPCDAFYLVKNGSVKVTRNRRRIVELGASEPVGEISFIDRGARSATVTAMEDTVLIKISSKNFDRLMKNDREIASKVYRAIAVTLCNRLRETNEVLKLMQA